MIARFILAAFAAHALLLAQQLKKTEVTPTSPTSGKEMYAHYCASCHGKEGKGDGPAAPAMKAAVTDLTRLTAKNKGKFPDLHVMHVIEGSDAMAAHGSSEMPIWGEVFRSTDGNAAAKARIAALTTYVQSIQAK